MSMKVMSSPVNAAKLPSLNGDNNYMYQGGEKDMEPGELVLDRIYVGGLNIHIGDRDLFHFFSEYGSVKHAGIITMRGVSMGYGFVTFTCREVVRRLLEGGEGDNLVLKGRRLRIGAARQRFGQNWGRGRGWTGHGGGNYNRARNPVREDVSKSSLESADSDQAGASQQEGDSHPFSSNYSPADPMPTSCTYTYDSVQPPSYPIYYPHYPGSEYPQYPGSEYPHYPGSVYSQYPVYITSVPSSDVTMYPNMYPDMTQIPLDACTTTNANYPTTNPIYPVTYSSQEGAYPVDVQSDQASSTAPYWPQSPMYPVLYNCGQSTMVQYSYPGEFYQPVPGYQDMALGWQDSSAYQDYQNVTPFTEHQNTVSYPPESDRSGFSEAHDSGYQDTSSGVQDTSIALQDQSGCLYQATDTELNYVDTSEGNGQDCYQRKNTENRTIVAVPKPNNSPQQSEQEKSQPNSQEQRKFTNLKPVINRLESAGDQPSFSQFGRNSRVFPSPYKSFGLYTGRPSPRHYPFPSGPRHYYSGQGQGRGRGRLWGYNSGGGSQGQGDKYRRPIQKKRKSKKLVETDKIQAEAGESLEDGLQLAGNHPDILQGPLQRLEIK
eukprot:GFUD01018214.1.p1 GENE.GFUD01018214.1~~GFUD01018214.1.p1  ORF type:complete len:603 (+),score=152.56 GFUD01018214.1:99-1907(+)